MKFDAAAGPLDKAMHAPNDTALDSFAKCTGADTEDTRGLRNTQQSAIGCGGRLEIIASLRAPEWSRRFPRVALETRGFHRPGRTTLYEAGVRRTVCEG